MDRDPDRARVVRDRPGDRLADPPRGIRRELEASPVLEPVDGLHEPDVALLDQIQQRQIAAEVALRHRHEQAQVRFHQLALGLAYRAIAPVDLLEERTELLAREPGALLEQTELTRGPGVAGPTGRAIQLADLLPAAPHLRHQIVDQGRLQGHLGHDVLDRLARDGDRGRSALAIGS